jgi:hypothetical protein
MKGPELLPAFILGPRELLLRQDKASLEAGHLASLSGCIRSLRWTLSQPGVKELANSYCRWENKLIRFGNRGREMDIMNSLKNPTPSIQRKISICYPGAVSLAYAILLLLPTAGALSDQTNSATIIGNCRSLSLSPVAASPPNGTVEQYFTTFDGLRGFPKDVLVNGNVLTANGEFRPRAGSPGVYEADYVSFASGQIADYGSVTINLPTADADDNGLPDATQKEMPLTATVSGIVTSDAIPQAGALTGTIHRDAGHTAGTYLVKINGLTFSGVTAIPYVFGAVSYSRKALSMTLSITFTAPNGQSVPMTGIASYKVLDSETIQLPSFAIRGGGLSLVTMDATLDRRGTNYVGDLNFLDEDPSTPWKDYGQWVVEITDVNDANRNGVPDLSDSLPVGPTILTPPASQTVQAGSGAVFRVVASGTLPLHFVWEVDGREISGATNAVLTLNGVTASQAGSYRAVVSNSEGSVVTTAAVLTVTAASTEEGSIPGPSGLLYWWPGEGNSKDIQSAKNGTSGGKLTYAPGKVGKAFSFNGTNAYVVSGRKEAIFWRPA